MRCSGQCVSKQSVPSVSPISQSFQPALFVTVFRQCFQSVASGFGFVKSVAWSRQSLGSDPSGPIKQWLPFMAPVPAAIHGPGSEPLSDSATSALRCSHSNIERQTMPFFYCTHPEQPVSGPRTPGSASNRALTTTASGPSKGNSRGNSKGTWRRTSRNTPGETCHGLLIGTGTGTSTSPSPSPSVGLGAWPARNGVARPTALAARLARALGGCLRGVSALALVTFSAATVADVPALSTRGNQVLIGGQPGSLAGSSLFWSNTGWGGEKFFNAQVVSWLKNDWKARLIRVPMGVNEGGGYLQDASNKARVMAMVEAAIANDMYVIIDWHCHVADQYKPQAIEFFREMASKYGKNNHVIYEIFNEPLQVSWSGVIKPYAQEVIAAIRAVDPDNLIIVGTPTWSQDVDAAAADPITGHPNIAYTLHFYAGTHGQWLRDKASNAMARGIPLFVTEWGSVNADGNGAVAMEETARWMDFMKANKLSHANWALNDKAEGASALVPGASPSGSWPLSQLTASGQQARNNLLSWPAPPAAGGGSGGGSGGSSSVVVQAESFSYMKGIQTEATSDAGGGLNVGWIDAGDWLSFSGKPVVVSASGNYNITYRVASLNGGGSFRLEKAGGGATYDTVSVPRTGGWQNWTNVTRTLYLNAGSYEFGMAMTGGGFNINWFKLESTSGAPTLAAKR